jgi:hypothetical protein
MKRAAFVAVVGMAIVGLMACGSGSSGARDAAGAERAFDEIAERVKESDWQSVYDATTEDYRAGCSYSAFLEAYAQPAQILDVEWRKVDFRDVRIEVDGTTARATYVWTYEGADFGAVDASDPDIYRWADGRWRPEPAPPGEC